MDNVEHLEYTRKLLTKLGSSYYIYNALSDNAYNAKQAVDYFKKVGLFKKIPNLVGKTNTQSRKDKKDKQKYDV